MRVGIVGAGHAGLVAAIALHQKDIDVVVLEQSDDFTETGAGIVVSPSIRRILLRLGFDNDTFTSVFQAQQRYVLRDAFSAEVIMVGDGSDWAEKYFGDCGRIGSRVRTFVAGREVSPRVIGDVAYRLLLSRSELELEVGDDASHDLRPILDMSFKAWTWMGPKRHAMLYPLRNGNLYNLVVLCPDTLAAGKHRSTVETEQLRSQIEGWDPVLRALLKSVRNATVSVLKIQYLRPGELPLLHRHNVALVGDSCHATLPYQGAGYSLAAEGAILLTELLSQNHLHGEDRKLSDVLDEYSRKHIERIRLQHEGAMSNRELFHLSDEGACKTRAEELSCFAWRTVEESADRASLPWTLGDVTYYKAQFDYDPYQHAVMTGHDQGCSNF
ncbi:FAD-binding domain-containing protein 68 [Elsinoe fawcettii]|nr:FAD-binding domain-containing protein 68 [Elsinoe fawcettii]